MQRLEVSGAVRPIYGSLGAKGLISAIDTVDDQRPSPASFTPGKEIFYALYRRFGGLQVRSGRV
jgi:hypothetical protein